MDKKFEFIGAFADEQEYTSNILMRSVFESFLVE